METLRWTEVVQIGVPSIDDTHEAQVRLVDAIERALSGSSRPEVVEELLLELVELTTEHFAHEQELMRASRYPGYEAHTEEHDRLLQHVSMLLSNYAAGHTALTLEIVRGLRPWLLDHIQGSDRAFGEYLNTRV